MRKTVIAFGILFSVMLTSANANTNIDPVKGPKITKKVTKTAIKNLAPLSIAVAQGDYEMVEKFLEYGSDIEQVSETMGMTPLMFAARYNNVKMLKLLVTNGAKTDVKSKLGMTASDYAKESNAADAISFLKKS